MEPSEGGFDPNEPDCTNGDFFCRLCLSSQNSESMWSSHIAGKRHIKNALKYPNGLPTRDFVHDEDSYEIPPIRDRFDDGYALHDDYPKPRYEDDYYYNKRPPMDYAPIIKRNIVIDYGHIKKLDDVVLPPVINKVPVIDPPPVLPSARPDSSAGFHSVSDPLLTKSKEKQPEVVDDFFEKINQREKAKELAKEIAKKGISIENLETALITSEKKTDDHKSEHDSPPRSHHDSPPRSRHDSPIRSRHDSSPHSRHGSRSRSRSRHRSPPHFRRGSALRFRRGSRRNSLPRNYRNYRNSRRDSPPHSHSSSRRDSPPHSHRNSRHVPPPNSARSYNKRGRHSPNVFDKNKDKKKIRLNDNKESKDKNTPLKKSSTKSKSIIDDLDPDELTPDILDTILSAQLSSKKPENSDEICKKKHCIDLNDPKIIAEKLESLSTMDFLNIIHKKLVSLDLKSPEELKLLLKVIAEAQVAVCKKLPPELQALVKTKLSMNDGDNPELPSQNPVVSQNQCITTVAASSKAISNNSFSSVSSSSPTTSVNTLTVVSPQTSLQFKPLAPPPIPNISLPLNKALNLPISNAPLIQNQTRPSIATSVMNTTPITTPVQLTAAPIQLTNVTSVNNPARLSNPQSTAIHSYYNSIFSMYQNRQSAPSAVPTTSPSKQSPVTDNILTRLTRFPPPPPPLPIQASPRPQLSQEVLNAIAKIRAQQPVKPSKQEPSGSKDSPPKSKEEIMQALRNLDILQAEYKRKKLLKLRNESQSNIPDNSSSSGNR